MPHLSRIRQMVHLLVSLLILTHVKAMAFSVLQGRNLIIEVHEIR
uniref:Uncharacterized protein n=1 Tax=Arundo donax TaxID=35708 RepID=A0A0A9C999_ARUDO